MTTDNKPLLQPCEVDTLIETRITGQHMVFTGDGRKRLQMVLDGQKPPLLRRFLRWLKLMSDRM